MTNIYVSFIQDRHTDPELAVFTAKQAALDHTRRRFKEVVAYPYSITEGDSGEFLLYLGYDGESDFALCAECPIRE